MSEQPSGLPSTAKNDTKADGAATDHQARQAPPGSSKQGAEPSGYKGDSPATAGPGPTALHSSTPENREGKLNPSAPGDAGITPGSDATK